MVQRTERNLLRVNLSTGQIQNETISSKDVLMFLGGRVLGNVLLYRELDAGIDPLSPENKLIFSTGPLTGTNAPGSSRYIVHTKSPLTGLYLNSLAGGYFGPELRKSGYDSIIIEGKSEYPVYLSITENEIKLVDARPYWGMTTGDTQEFIKSTTNSKARVACIGPAGENLVPYAAIISERRAVGRGGAGAVMGSKNLKAVVVRGQKKVELADPEAFRAAVKHAMKDISDSPLSKLFPLYGSLLAMPALNEAGIIPYRNWQDAADPEGKNLFAETWRDKYVKKDVRCAPPCTLKCSKITLATEGPHAGTMAEGPEYESEYALGACCGITDQAAVIEADALCDQYGLDCMSMGVSIAFAMECFEKGIITEQDTDGDDFRFGNARLLAKYIRKTAYQQGFGKTLSYGTKIMSEQFGKESEDFAMHTKGMELGGYDPRGAKSLALVYACGARGGCHKSHGSANGLSLRELRSPDERFKTEGKAELTRESLLDRIMADSAILCIFPQAATSDEAVAEMLSAAIGISYTIEDLHVIAERGNHIERAFNVREGLRRSWDTLPKRLLKESVQSGPTKGQIVELETLLNDYYALSGWDIESGIPLPEKCKELGLDSLAKDMESYLKEA